MNHRSYCKSWPGHGCMMWLVAALAWASAAASSVHSHHALRTFPPSPPPFNAGGIDEWPRAINRVAVMPLHDTTSALRPAALDEYDRIWLGLLQQTERAEFVNLSRDQTRRWLQGSSVESTTALPPELFSDILAATDAQAVIMLDIVFLPPHRAGALGLRVKLIELNTERILWMADESFDLQRNLSRSTIDRFLKAREGIGQVGNPRVALRQSPSLFAALAMETILQHVPPRRPIRKKNRHAS